MTAEIESINDEGGSHALLPNPSYLIDPANEIDVEILVQKTQDNSDFMDQSFLTIFDELNAETSGLGHRNDTNEMLSFLAQRFSHFFSAKSSFDGAEFTPFYLAWTRISESFENDRAAQNILIYAIKNQAKDEIIAHWAKAEFNHISDDLSTIYRTGLADKAANRIHQLVKIIAPVQPDLALSFAFQLMEVSRNNQFFDRHKGRAKKAFDSLLSQHQGIVVLDRIEPTLDRTVKATCDRFESLTSVPVKLAPINDVDALQAMLDKEFPWFCEVTAKIAQSLRLRLLGDGGFYIAPKLLVGMPGIGKTSYLNRLSKLTSIPFRTISLSGKNDNRDIVGTSRGWGSGHPGMVISLINEHQIANPIILLDEVDKCGGSDHNGRLLDSLLSMLEHATSSSIYDEYLCGRCNYSKIIWMGSANSIAHIPSALLSRFDVANIEAPKREHYPQIVRTSINSFCEQNGIHHAHVPTIDDADWKWLEKFFRSPRLARKATEKWLAFKLLTPQENRLN